MRPSPDVAAPGASAPMPRPAAAPPKPRVLCVDDEPQVLDGLTLNLRRKFDVHVALGGTAGLQRCESDVYAVVISDMRMPGMNGAVFLSNVRQRWPDTVRMLLTGHAEIESAIAAVNEGQIFRFLAKPCPADKLIAAVEAAVEQHRLVTAEKVLLEQTLRGSIKALTDILSLQNPLAFGRATRAKAQVAALLSQMGIAERWQLEVAAMLSPIGTVTLPAETVEKLYDGRPLSQAEQAMVKRMPMVTEQLLANIPRLEPVREILALLDARFDGDQPPPSAGGLPTASTTTVRKGADLPLGSRMLRLVLDYDLLECQGLDRKVALDTLRGRRGQYDPDLVDALAVLLGAQDKQVVEELGLALIHPGMVLMDDVRSLSGGLLIARGHEVTASLIERIRNVSRNVGVKEPLRVLVPAALRSHRE
jgi:response regulator RpfG family c-di-GMP phosphodiesterase